MNGFYVDTVPVEKQKKREKERGFGKRIGLVNNKNACVGVCLYFDNVFIN